MVFDCVCVFRGSPEFEMNAQIEGVLVTEVGIILLDTLELIVQVRWDISFLEETSIYGH